MIDERINFRHIRCFLEVTRLSSVARAASSLNLAQSAVSRTLADLEAIVGVKLLDRSRRGSHLTRSGQEFHDLVAPGAAQIRRAYSLMDPRPEAPQTITIGAVPTVLTSLMPEVLAEFQAQNRHVTVRVIEARNAALLRLLRSGEVDVVIGRLLVADAVQGLAFEHLFEERVDWFVRMGHPLLELKGVTLIDLADWPVVANLPESLARSEFGRLLLSGGVHDQCDLIETNSVSLSLRLALDKERVWLTPELTASSSVEAGTMVRLGVRDWHLARPIGFWLNPKVKLGLKARDLMDAFRTLSQGIT